MPKIASNRRNGQDKIYEELRIWLEAQKNRRNVVNRDKQTYRASGDYWEQKKERLGDLQHCGGALLEEMIILRQLQIR